MNQAMHSPWTERLSPYLDGELTDVERVALEGHLAECAACRAALDDITRIVSLAPAYQGSAPARDLWPEIAAGIDRSREIAFPPAKPAAHPRRQFSLGHLLAASVAFAVIGAGAAWLAGREPASLAAGSPAVEPAVVAVSASAKADAAYDQAVLDLASVLAQGRGRLDTATVRVIEDNLAIIDRAIAEARAAIAKDPANGYLNSQVAANKRRKLDLLRRAADAVTASAS